MTILLPPAPERRNSDLDRSQLEVRADKDKPTVIEGYAAVFEQPTVIWDFEEVIARGAFSRVLKEKPDVRTLFNHDPNYPLARTKNGTLILREDEKGLWTESEPPRSPIADSIVESIRRKDVDGMSFAFTVRKQEWIFSEEPGIMDRRVITEIGQMYDVGPVTFPAYQQTSVKIREEAKKMHAEARSRWSERRTVVQVPKEYQFSLCECRSNDAEDTWVIEPRGEEKPIEKVEEPAKAPEEAPEKRGDADESKADSDKPVQVFEPDAETLSREVALRKRVQSASAETRGGLYRK